MNKYIQNELVILIVMALILQIPFINVIPGIMVDEPWYANTAWNFSLGNGFTNTVPGAYGGDDLFLYTLLLGIAFKIFGTSLLVARIVSIVAGIFSLAGIYQILKVLKVKNPWILSTVGTLFIFSNVNYIIFRSARPEGWIVAFGVWALYYLIKGYKTDKKLMFFTSGFLSSAIFLMHPHGAIFIIIFGSTVLFRCYHKNKVKGLFYFVIGMIPVSLALIYYIFSIRQQSVSEFLLPWQHRVALSNAGFIQSQIENLAVFFSTYTLGVKRLYILFFEIGMLLYGAFFLKRNKWVFIISSLGLSYFFIAIIFLSPFSTRHFSEIIIFSIVSFGLILNHYSTNYKMFKIFMGLGILYLINNLGGDFYIISKGYDRTPYSQIETKIDSIVPDDTKVLTLLNFWFPLKNNQNYNRYTRWNKSNYKNLDDLFDSKELDYIVISDYMTKGTTATSGRIISKKKNSLNELFYTKVSQFAHANGMLIKKIPTVGYGSIEVWKIQFNEKFKQ